MSQLLIHPEINYQFLPVKLELCQPMDLILFHFVDNSGDDLDGYNLFSISPTGLDFKTGVHKGFTTLDIEESNGRILNIIGVDMI